jgi:hypothetical protein
VNTCDSEFVSTATEVGVFGNSVDPFKVIVDEYACAAALTLSDVTVDEIESE